MEAMNMTTPSISFSDPVHLDNILNLAESTNLPSITIKMEDLEASSSQDSTTLTSQPETSSLASASADSKSQPKKRKSWGQELPEPKTNLPPRKRAKTADEKEQRRIERVKRNRLAAHNSRERKRQEVDELQKQLDMHKIEINHLQARVRQQDQALHFYQLKYPGISPDSSMLAFQPQAPEFISPNPLLQTSIGYQHSMASNSSPSTSPGLPPSMTDSPDSLLKTLDSPATSGSQPATPPTEMHGLFTTTPNQCKKVDQTQHSAVSVDFPHGFGVNTPQISSYHSSFHLPSNLQSHHLFAPTHDFELFGAGADDLLANVPNPLPLDTTPLLSSFVGPDVHETGLSDSTDLLEDMHTAGSGAHPVCDEPGTAALFEEFLVV